MNPLCLICEQESETLEHFFYIKCNGLQEVRNPILKDINNVLHKLIIIKPDVKDHCLLQLIVDCNVVDDGGCSPETYELLEKLQFYSRRLCYSLHAVRFKKLELIPKRNKNRKTNK